MSKYFFFDIDGTLTSVNDHTKVSTSTLKALKQLEENGHFVALATGRAHFRAKLFADSIGISNMVCEGGNGLYINGELVHYEPLNQDYAHAICAEALAKKIPMAIALEDSPIRYSQNNEFNEKAGLFADFMEVRINSELDYQKETTIRRIFLALTPDEENQLSSITEIGVMRYNDKFLIIEPDDKYKGIKQMMKILEADEKEVVVFGDGLNDRKMFKEAPFKIAMGNAVTELKELADYVTSDSDSDGIANALLHFGWIE